MEQFKTAGLDELLKAGSHYFTYSKAEMLRQAYSMVRKAYQKASGYDVEAVLFQHIQIALTITQEIGLGTTASLSAMLYSSVKKGFISKNQVSEIFYPAVLTVIKGMLEVDKLDIDKAFSDEKDKSDETPRIITKRNKKFAKSKNETYKIQAENFRKLFLALSEDIRVILIKLAYQIYEMRHIKSLSDEKRIILCRQSYYMFAPIAHQLGLYHIKTELEENSMKYLESDIYQHIAKKLDETKTARDTYIEKFISPLQNELKTRKIRAEIKGRPKSIHSIWNKMRKQGVEFEGIYDLFAIRIILDDDFKDVKAEKAACWQVYSLVTDFYDPNPLRLRDWISAPKSSGYESLHTTVSDETGKWVEVQIRTRRMDDIAEKGHAAHWKYKEVKGDSGHDNWLEQIRNVLENSEKQEEDEAAQIKSDLYSDALFAFTPKGELIKLREGATVLDFAYNIHTRLGEQCIGANINGKHKGLKDKLKNGDHVEILTSKKQKPKKEWLNFVVSSKSRSRIKRYLKAEENKLASLGKDILKEKFAELQTQNTDLRLELNDVSVITLRNHFNYSSYIEFYGAIGQGEVEISPAVLHNVFVAPRRIDFNTALDNLHDLQADQEQSTNHDFLLIGDKMAGIDFQLAKCCNPIPGDSIFGFITVTKGTKIHKINCPNALDLMKRYPYRMVRAKWKNDTSKHQFLVKITVFGVNSTGVVSKISSVISHEVKVNMTGINIQSKKDGMFEGIIDVNINSLNHLGKLLAALKKINGIMSAKRLE